MLDIGCWIEMFQAGWASFLGIAETPCSHGLEVHHDITLKCSFVTQFLGLENKSTPCPSYSCSVISCGDMLEILLCAKIWPDWDGNSLIIEVRGSAGTGRWTHSVLLRKQERVTDLLCNQPAGQVLSGWIWLLECVGYFARQLPSWWFVGRNTLLKHNDRPLPWHWLTHTPAHVHVPLLRLQKSCLGVVTLRFHSEMRDLETGCANAGGNLSNRFMRSFAALLLGE